MGSILGHGRRHAKQAREGVLGRKSSESVGGYPVIADISCGDVIYNYM